MALKRHDEAASAARTRRSAMTEDEPVWLFLVPIHKGAYNAALRAVYVMEFFQKAPREQQEMVTSSFHEMMTLVRASMSTRPIKRALYRRRLHATRKDPAVVCARIFEGAQPRGQPWSRWRCGHPGRRRGRGGFVDSKCAATVRESTAMAAACPSKGGAAPQR